jgi:hypothetical protein
MTPEAYAEHQLRVHGPQTITPKKPPKAKNRYQKKREFSILLAQQIRDAKLDDPILEYAFAAQLGGNGRGWQFDLCWPIRRLAFEVDGAVHRIKAQFKTDMEKHQEAMRLNFRTIRVSPAQVRSGEALEFVRRELA